MTAKGVVRGNVVEVDGMVPFVDGASVEIRLWRTAPPVKDAAAALLDVAGMLSDEVADDMLACIEDAFEEVEPDFRESQSA